VAERGKFRLRDLTGQRADDDHGEDFVGRDLRLVDDADELPVEHHADPVGQVEDIMDVVADDQDPGVEMDGARDRDGPR
jgi:hypothetical protein